MLGYALLIVAATLNGIANLFLKLGADRGISMNSGSILAFLSHHQYLIFGVILFAGNVLIYILALRALPISVAYPLMVALSFIVVGIAATIFLGEEVTPLKILGYALILLGIALISGFRVVQA